MKRIFAIILSLNLCLALSACGGGASDRGEYDRLLDMLDEHNYTGAVEYINNLAYEYAQENKDDAAEKYIYTAALIGEWKPYQLRGGDTQPPAIRFNADGTCSVGDKSYLWEVTDERKDGLSVQILDGATQVHHFNLSKNTIKGYFTASSSNIVKNTHINFYNPAHFEVVEMSTDTWNTYFEEREYYTFETNDFKEVTGVYVNRHWRLKEAYYSRLWIDNSKVAVEYTLNSGKQPAKWDLANRTCTLAGQFEPILDKGAPVVLTRTETISGFMDASTADPDDSYYGYRYMSTPGMTNDEGEQYFPNYWTNVKLTRVQGNLYLVKEEIQKIQKPEE